MGEGTPLGRDPRLGRRHHREGVRRRARPRGEEPGAARVRPPRRAGHRRHLRDDPQGADHTAGYAIATNILKVGGFVDPLKTEGQVELSRNLQIATAAIDSTGMCLFIAFAIMDQPETFQALLDLLNSFYGLSLTGDDVVARSGRRSSPPSATSTRGGVHRPGRSPAALLRAGAARAHKVTFMVKGEELDQLFNWN